MGAVYSALLAALGFGASRRAAPRERCRATLRRARLDRCGCDILWQGLGEMALQRRAALVECLAPNVWHPTPWQPCICFRVWRSA